jgi:hypothetical protein
VPVLRPENRVVVNTVVLGTSSPTAWLDKDTPLARVNVRLRKTQRISALRFIEALLRSPIGRALKRALREPQHCAVD